MTVQAESSGKRPRGRKVRPDRRASELWGRSGSEHYSVDRFDTREAGRVLHGRAKPLEDGRRPTMPLKKREQAGGIRSGVWVMAPGEWSTTQSGEGLTLMSPCVQAVSGCKTRGGREIGGSGRSSDEGRDNITLPEQRTRGEAACSSTRGPAPTCPATAEPTGTSGRVAETALTGPSNLAGHRAGRNQEATSRTASLKPYWGKPTVRNFRGALGVRGHGAC